MRKENKAIITGILCVLLLVSVLVSLAWHDDPLPYISSEKVEMVWCSWPFQSVHYEGEFHHNGWESTTVIVEERIWKRNLFGLKLYISNSSDIVIDTRRYIVIGDSNFPKRFKVFEKKSPPFPDGYPAEFRRIKELIRKARSKVKEYFSYSGITFSPQVDW